MTLNEQVPVRFSESVAVQVTVVVPIGKVRPEAGEHVTFTEPLPSVTGGASKSTATPPALTVVREMPSTHASDGGFATGGGGGGGGGVGCRRRPAAGLHARFTVISKRDNDVPKTSLELINLN